MNDSKQTQSDGELEAKVLATRDDPALRQLLPFVPPSSSPRPESAIRAEQRNGVPLMPRRPEGHTPPSMETVNKLRDEK